MNLIDELIGEGILEGIEKEKKETVVRSWQNGIDMPMIDNITGLSLADVEKIITDFKSKT